MRTRSSEQEDYLLRIIRQAAEALRRLREMLTSSAAASPTVRAEVHDAVGQLLGPDAALLSRLDAETAVRLLGDHVRAGLWADLLDLDATASVAGGDEIAATTQRTRAAALRAAAARSDENL